MYSKRQEEEQQGTENDAAKGTSLARQVLLLASSPMCSSSSTLGNRESSLSLCFSYQLWYSNFAPESYSYVIYSFRRSY